jgi:hypothetical protein
MADEALLLDLIPGASAPPSPVHDRPNRLRSHPIRYDELVAHLYDHPRVFVTTCCDHEEGTATEDIVAQPDLADLVTCPPHVPPGATPADVALLSARDCVEPASYRGVLNSAQAPYWQTAMQQEYDSLMDNGT